ncbi:unnamed protein product, partial [marine sediment metagenome]
RADPFKKLYKRVKIELPLIMKALKYQKQPITPPRRVNKRKFFITSVNFSFLKRKLSTKIPKDRMATDKKPVHLEPKHNPPIIAEIISQPLLLEVIQLIRA